MDIKVCDECTEIIGSKYYQVTILEIDEEVLNILDEHMDKKVNPNSLKDVLDEVARKKENLAILKTKAEVKEICEVCKKVWDKFKKQRKKELFKLRKEFHQIIDEKKETQLKLNFNRRNKFNV